MYHWIKIFDKEVYKNHLRSDSGLFAGNDNKLIESANKKVTWTLFWFGLIEFIPFSSGFVLSFATKELVFKYDYLLIGFILMLTISFLLNKWIPQTPIGIKRK